MPRIALIGLLLGGLSNQLLAQERAGKARVAPQEQQFQQWDKNQDGQLVVDELPENLRGNFRQVDRDNDGQISLQEHLQFLNRNRLPDSAVAKRDIAYVTDGHERQKLDLYLPKVESDKALPVVIWVHGGGWQNGNRSPCPALFLVDEGYAVASLSYRLSGDALFPAQIHDCKAAIRFLRSKAEEFNIDPARFGAWGSSAGGHLVALLGTSGNAPELEGTLGVQGNSSEVQAVCDYFGPTDLLQMANQSTGISRIDHDAANSPESKLVGGPLQEKAELATQANPITYVDAKDPPFMIVHGDADPLVPYQQSQLLEQALNAVGVQVQLTIVPEGGHGPFRSPEELQQVNAFFDSVLKP